MALFAKYEGIDGESTDTKHKKWIEMLSLDWGAHMPEGGGPSRRRGAAVVEDMVLTLEYGKAAPKLQEKCLKGEIIPKLEIELTSTHGDAKVTYLKYELKNVRISAYQTNASGNDENTPKVIASNSFEKIKVTYTEYDRSGSIKGRVETEFKRSKR